MGSNVIDIINLIITVLSFAIIGRSLLSWIDPGMQSPVGRFLRDITEPIIGPIRQIIPSMGMFDISPIIALLLLQVIGRMLNQALVN